MAQISRPARRHNFVPHAGVVQLTKHRKKFQYVPVPGPGSTAAKAQQIQDALDQLKLQSGQHAQQDIAALRLRLQHIQQQALLRGESFAPVQDVQKELLAYEKQYLQHGHAWHRAEQQIGAIAGVSLVPVVKNPAKGERYYVEDTTTGTRIGKVYVAESRYESLGILTGALHPVFQIRGRPGRHFVQDANNNYVRRFVIRGLNDADAEKLGGAKALESAFKFVTTAEHQEVVKGDTPTRHPGPRGTNVTSQQQILSHTRGWYKRFISTTTTRRPALSTRGTEFRSLFGAAVVDLAKVPKANIFDLHAPKVAQTLFGNRTSDIVNAPAQPTAAATLAEEKFLAQRDVIRTREVLIQQTLPFAALSCAESAKRVLAFGVDSKVKRADLVTHLQATWGLVDPNRTEEVNRPSMGMSCWLFYQFDSQTDLDAAYAGGAVFNGFAHKRKTKTLKHYDPVTGQAGNA